MRIVEATDGKGVLRLRRYMTVGDVTVAYDIDGQGENMLLLHGWGGNAKSFFPIHQALSASFRVISIDFPGYGESTLPPTVWGVGEYAECVCQFLRQLDIEQTHIISHSFGARVTIWLAAHHPDRVGKITLVGAAGLKPKRSWNYYARVYAFKTGKRLNQWGCFGPGREARLERWRQRMGSQDYKDAGPMRAIMVRVANQYLESLLPRIQSSTLLVWGENDTATPVRDGKYMAAHIPDAGLVVLPGAGHYCYLDRLGSFLKIVKHFYLGSS